MSVPSYPFNYTSDLTYREVATDKLPPKTMPAWTSRRVPKSPAAGRKRSSMIVTIGCIIAAVAIIAFGLTSHDSSGPCVQTLVASVKPGQGSIAAMSDSLRAAHIDPNQVPNLVSAGQHSSGGLHAGDTISFCLTGSKQVGEVNGKSVD